MSNTSHLLSAELTPHSLEAEKTVLGAVLLDPEKIYSVAQLLAADDFFDPVYRRIFTACLQLASKAGKIDFVTVANELSNDQQIEGIGGSAFLATLAAEVPTSSHAEQYARIVNDCARKRAVIKAGQTITRLGSDTEHDAQTIVEQSTQAVLDLMPNSSTNTELAADIHQRRYETVSELHANPKLARQKYVYTGFGDLDLKIGGMMPHTLTILAARPAMGKSTLALNIARNAANNGKSTMLFSAEMSKDEILDRIASSELGVDYHDIQRGNLTEQQISQYGTIYDEIRDTPLYIDDDHNNSITNIRHKAMQQQLRHGLDLLIVDYLQLLTVPKSELRDDSGNRTVSFISRSLKVLAKQLNIPILALSQLSRQPEIRNDPRPILSDLRDSGSLEQDADNVLMLFRPDYYQDDNPDEAENPAITNVYIRKQRNGPTGVVDLMFDRKHLKFTSLHRDQSAKTM